MQPPSNYGVEFVCRGDCFELEIDPNTMTLAEIMAKSEAAISMAIQSQQTKFTELEQLFPPAFILLPNHQVLTLNS